MTINNIDGILKNKPINKNKLWNNWNVLDVKIGIKLASNMRRKCMLIICIILL